MNNIKLPLILFLRLTSYINMFGLKFSKEDHVALVRLFYQVLVQVDMDPPTMDLAAISLNTLLEKTYLIEVSRIERLKFLVRVFSTS